MDNLNAAMDDEINCKSVQTGQAIDSLAERQIYSRGPD